ncbi:hypothetical protein C475_09254 [Halosimplex carlsbadense 2-9-1]|uniref:Uncharacterized protein n=1 Tax=Halosimplex carlsbadense 2-9-1 TaxID=797114 RepID=M0CUS4_9EURY|nr:hypothetical protein [Halosimplex carlsbadense]ELZ25634.1 hypothetical protein C475_09254 [Halosimplex carlsbadense 2-9-1]
MVGTLRAALGGLGVLATLLGALAVAAPAAVAETAPLSTLVSAAATVGPRDLFVAGSAALGLSLLRAAVTSRGSRLVSDSAAASRRFAAVVAAEPETATAPDGTLAAGEFDEAVERAVEGDERALTGLRERLRRLAVARLGRAGWDPEAADRAVAAGTWTDDHTAAVFLSEESGPVATLGARLRLWLDPESERERRVRRTVAALDEVAEPTADEESVRGASASGESVAEASGTVDEEPGGAAS